ncbi:MAG: hypothetical protein EZS28_026237, partial [Streblomastix strix]
MQEVSQGRYKKVGLVEQVQNINQQIIILQNIPQSYDQEQLDALLLLKADITDIVDSQFKMEDYSLLLLKADKTQLIDSYSKSETYFRDEVYTKPEDDALLLLKADKSELIDSYSKYEDDTLLDSKAIRTDLDNFVDLTSAQTVSCQKQFEIINVSNISKQSKNDASILLAGGGDMLVSSLVTQPQLQKVRDIITGKSKRYMFSIQEKLYDLMAIRDNVTKLVIADNLYIVEKEVTDYWWDETDLKILETEQIDGNTLTPAKNTTFDIQGFDQSITGMKTFSSRIISNGIQYFIFDNSSVFLAAGGVRSLVDIQSVFYTKSEDDALLLLKANKTQLIDSYSKIETNNLQNNKTDNGYSYSKSETYARSDVYTKGVNDALLLLKADKTQLIDSYTKGEADNLLNNKVNQSTAYTKIETDQFISLIEVDDVDLDGYLNLSTAETITANKTFNNACRFVSSIDGMSTVTGSAFIKSCADDTDVLLGRGGTKPISEFVGALTDLSNYYTKIQTYSRTEADNKYVKLEGSIQQTITGRLEYVSQFGGTYGETQDPIENTYLAIGEVDAKLSSQIDSSILGNIVNTIQDQTFNGSKTFTSNVSATGFVKAGKDSTSVLLAGGGDKLLSAFGGLELVTISYTSNVVSPTSISSLKFYRYGSPVTFYGYIYMGNGAGASGASVAVCTLESAGFPKYLFYADDIVFAGSAPYITNFRFGTEQKVTITIIALTGTAVLFLNYEISYEISSVYIDEALLDATGLSKFPVLYAYIHERESKPIVDGIANQLIVGPQYLHDQVKDNDEKLSVQPLPPSPITPIPVAAEVITVPLYTLTQPLLPHNINNGR